MLINFALCIRAVGAGPAGPAAAGPISALCVTQNVGVAEALQHSCNDFSHTRMFTTPRVTAATSIRAQHGRVAVLKRFNFPKRQFGTKGEERSFRAEWCDTFSWLRYDVKTNTAFCYLCMRYEAEKKFL